MITTRLLAVDDDLAVPLQQVQDCLAFVAPLVHRVAVSPCPAAAAVAPAGVDARAAALAAKHVPPRGPAVHDEEDVPRLRVWYTAFVLRVLKRLANVVGTHGSDTDDVMAWAAALVLRCGMGVEEVLSRVNSEVTVSADNSAGAGAGAGAGASADAAGDGDSSHPPTDEDDDSDISDAVDADKQHWSKRGAGMLVHTLLGSDFGRTHNLVPDVTAPHVWLQQCSHVVTKLLGCQVPSLRPRQLGMELLQSLVSRVPPGSASVVNAVALDSSTAEFVLAQQLISFVVTCPDAPMRQRGYRLLMAYVQAFRPRWRFWLLRQLVAACPFDQVKGLLLDALRRDANGGWGKPPYDDGDAMMDVLYGELRALPPCSRESLDDKFDLHLGLLNFYRFLLLKDKGRTPPVTPVWSKDAIHRMNNGYLRALGEGVADAERLGVADVPDAPVDGETTATSSPLSRLALLSAALMPVMELLDDGGAAE